MESLKSISEFLYSWILNNRENGYKEIFSNMNGGGHGMTYALYCLLAVTTAAVLIYYFVVAANATNATKKNFLITMLVGLFFLLVLNFIVLGTFAVNFTGDILVNENMWRLTGIDILYYLVLSEVLCWFIKGMSNAKYIDWISLFTNK